MPFKSQAQRGFMYANHPNVAKKFESETPKGKLPYKVGGKSGGIGLGSKGPLAHMFGKGK